MTQDWSKEKVAALIDGSIDDDRDADSIRRGLESEPEARAYADKIRRSNAFLREALAVPAEEPAPAAIDAAIFGEPGKTAVLGRRPAARSWVPAALAASIALVVGLSAGHFLDRPQERMIAALGTAPLDSPLHAALETAPSGRISDEGIQPMLSFLDGAGRPCREFEVIHELPNELEFGIACRSSAGQWHVEIVVAAPVTEPGPDGYAPASGPASKALDAMLDALNAGPAMPPDLESSLLARGWRVTES